jgi:hypothetical protein
MTQKACQPWYDEDHSLLSKLWRDGHSKADIAQRLGRSIPAIEKRVAVLKLLPRQPHRSGCKPGPSKFDGMAAMESNMRKQDQRFIEAMLNAGYVMTKGQSTLNSSGSSR